MKKYFYFCDNCKKEFESKVFYTFEIPLCPKCNGKMRVIKEDFAIKCEVCNVIFKNPPSCEAVCPYKVSEQYQIYSEKRKKEKIKIPISLDKWM